MPESVGEMEPHTGTGGSAIMRPFRNADFSPCRCSSHKGGSASGDSDPRPFLHPNGPRGAPLPYDQRILSRRQGQVNSRGRLQLIACGAMVALHWRRRELQDASAVIDAFSIKPLIGADCSAQRRQAVLLL